MYNVKVQLKKTKHSLQRILILWATRQEWTVSHQSLKPGVAMFKKKKNLPLQKVKIKNLWKLK